MRGVSLWAVTFFWLAVCFAVATLAAKAKEPRRHRLELPAVANLHVREAYARS